MPSVCLFFCFWVILAGLVYLPLHGCRVSGRAEGGDAFQAGWVRSVFLLWRVGNWQLEMEMGARYLGR